MPLNRLIIAQIVLYMHIIHIWIDDEKKLDCSDWMRPAYNRDSFIFFCVFIFTRKKRNVQQTIWFVCESRLYDAVTFISVYSITFFFDLDAGHAMLSTVMALHKTTQSYTKKKTAIYLYTGHDINSIRCCRFSLLCKLLISTKSKKKAQIIIIMRCEKGH